MRVGLFTNNYLPFRGGVTTAVETLRQGLEALGHRAWVFAPAAQPPQADPPYVFRYPSIPAPTYPGFALPLPVLARASAGVARALDLDVVHAHHPFLLGLTGRRLARRQRRPLVFTYHTRYEKYAHYVPLPPRLVPRLAVRLACRFADSRGPGRWRPPSTWPTRCGARGVRAPVAVVPTGVDLELFRPGAAGSAARRRLGLPADGLICLYTGRLDREKSLERVLDAFESVAGALSDAPRCTWWARAATPRRSSGAPPRARRGGRIVFHGGLAREALPDYYRAADLFLFASETETQGLVLAEAHACGLPAVAVRASGVEEVVADGETGILTKADDAASWPTRPSGSCWTPGAARAWARRARRLVEARFAAPRQTAAMVAHYEALLARRH